MFSLLRLARHSQQSERDSMSKHVQNHSDNMTAEIRMTVFIELNLLPKIIAKQFYPSLSIVTMNVTKFARVSCAFLNRLRDSSCEYRASRLYRHPHRPIIFSATISPHTNSGMVVAFSTSMDPKSSALANSTDGTEQEVNADTSFRNRFHAPRHSRVLLVLDMAQRGELNLNDPVQNICRPLSIPALTANKSSFKTLRAQDSGLPFNATNLSGKDGQRAIRQLHRR